MLLTLCKCMCGELDKNACVYKHVLQADLCKPIKFICAIQYPSMKMCFASNIEAIFKCRVNKDRRWPLARVCSLLYVYLLKLQNLLIIFHLLSDKQQISVSEFLPSHTCSPRWGEWCFSQLLPGIMEHFVFQLDVTISKAVSAIAAGTASVSVLLPFAC